MLGDLNPGPSTRGSGCHATTPYSLIVHYGQLAALWGLDTLGFEPRAFRMRSGCDTTTPCARLASFLLFLNVKVRSKIRTHKRPGREFSAMVNEGKVCPDYVLTTAYLCRCASNIARVEWGVTMGGPFSRKCPGTGDKEQFADTAHSGPEPFSRILLSWTWLGSLRINRTYC